MWLSQPAGLWGRPARTNETVGGKDPFVQLALAACTAQVRQTLGPDKLLWPSVSSGNPDLMTGIERLELLAPAVSR